jgi:hypothetical protein
LTDCAELFISADTVDHHVSAILAKPGAPNRNAAAAQATRLGLVGGAGAAENAGDNPAASTLAAGRPARPRRDGGTGGNPALKRPGDRR